MAVVLIGGEKVTVHQCRIWAEEVSKLYFCTFRGRKQSRFGAGERLREKGGTGKTTLAMNLAAMLVIRDGLSVIEWKQDMRPSRKSIKQKIG
jgi:hypothetical protein